MKSRKRKTTIISNIIGLVLLLFSSCLFATEGTVTTKVEGGEVFYVIKVVLPQDNLVRNNKLAPLKAKANLLKHLGKSNSEVSVKLKHFSILKKMKIETTDIYYYQINKKNIRYNFENSKQTSTIQSLAIESLQ